MSRVKLFLDSSALFAGVASPTGAARALLLLGETQQITLIISEQVVAETEQAVARKLPDALSDLRQAIYLSHARIVRSPTKEEVQEHLRLIGHPADVPILLAAMRAGVDYLVTLNRKHFLGDPNVALLSGLRIGAPGDALAWVREQIGKG